LPSRNEAQQQAKKSNEQTNKRGRKRGDSYTRTHGPNATAGAHDDEEERSPEYLIPRTRRRLPHPSAAGKRRPQAATSRGEEEADETVVFNTAAGDIA